MIEPKQRIKEIQIKLSQSEKADYIYVTKSVQQLRHHVLYLHTTFEASIDKIIIKHILKDANLTAQTPQKKASINHNIRMVLNEVDFSKKLRIVQKQKSLSKKLISKLYSVNDIRVYFAHPTTFRVNLISYQNEKSLLNAYEVLNSALDALKQEGIEDRPLILYPPKNSRKTIRK